MTTTNSRTKQGFSLMELLVVMAILTILMAMVAPRAGNLIASSREHKCRNNLRQLQAAVISHMNDKEGGLPRAMSYEGRWVWTGDEEHDWIYWERRGWIAWSPDKNPTAATADRLNTLWRDGREFEPQEPGLFHDLGTGALGKFGVENGTLFEYMNRSYEHYVCPVIRAGFKDASVYRTYAMNPFFHGPDSRSDRPRIASRIGSSEKYDGYTPEASKLLLFVETLPGTKEPYQRTYDWDNPSSNKGKFIYRGDCCIMPPDDELQTDPDKDLDTPPFGDPEDTRTYPYLHKIPKGSFEDPSFKMGVVGMAVFFDGHIEKILSATINPVWAYNRGLDPWRKEGSE